jgi:hypothetical protein
MKQARSPIVAVILALGSLPAVKLVASGLALVALFAAVVLYHARVSRWRAAANVRGGAIATQGQELPGGISQADPNAPGSIY